MNTRQPLRYATSALAGLALVLATAAAADVTIFDDDFSGLKPGLVSSDVVGAHAEYHYLDATAPKGNWTVSAFRSNGSQRAWRAVRDHGRPELYQSYSSTKNDAAYTHPIVVAGDPLWQDYTLTVRFTPQAKQMQSGVLFRYRNDRCYYFFGVIGDRAVLKSVNHATKYRGSTEKTLAERPFAWQPGKSLVATITVNGNSLAASLDGQAELRATDATFAVGRIGLMSDVPTRYERVTVTMPTAAAAAFRTRTRARETELAQLEAANPKPVLWKKISTDGFGTGRQLRFGDLDGDGRIDILAVQVKRHGPKDRNSEVGCFTAITLDGKRLWRVGEEDLWNDLLTNDVAVQIYDIDQDSRNEVIYTKDLKLIIADSATGKVKRAIPTPENHARPPYDKFPRSSAMRSRSATSAAAPRRRTSC